jgi:hypothetical protein
MMIMMKMMMMTMMIMIMMMDNGHIDDKINFYETVHGVRAYCMYCSVSVENEQ